MLTILGSTWHLTLLTTKTQFQYLLDENRLKFEDMTQVDIQIGGTLINLTLTVRNLGTMFEKSFTADEFLSKFFHPSERPCDHICTSVY